MDKIANELSMFTQALNEYREPGAIMNDEHTLDKMELSAKRLYAEVIYFRAKKNVEYTLRDLKISSEIKAQKEGVNESI
jgi:hypothetical protein